MLFDKNIDESLSAQMTQILREHNALIPNKYTGVTYDKKLIRANSRKIIRIRKSLSSYRGYREFQLPFRYVFPKEIIYKIAQFNPAKVSLASKYI